MKAKLIQHLEEKLYGEAKKLPSFRPGDTVKVFYRIQEGTDQKKFRVQPFEGVVIKYKKGKVEGSFTVRRISANGVGVERTFPVISPNIEKVQVLAAGSVRRSRLYYLRALTGKAARIKSRYVPPAASTNS